MMMIVVFILFWVVCSLPFAMIGIPSEASIILGLITEIIIIVYMSSKSNGESTHQATRRPAQSGGSSCSVSDDDIEEMVMLDMLDGDLDGKF